MITAGQARKNTEAVNPTGDQVNRMLAAIEKGILAEAQNGNNHMFYILSVYAIDHGYDEFIVAKLRNLGYELEFEGSKMKISW